MSLMKNAGSKWQAGRKGTEIAALIRGEVRGACKADGPLKGCKVSVRFSWSTHSKAVDIVVQAAPVPVLSAEYVRHAAANPHDPMPAGYRYSDAGKAILSALRGIAAQYNRIDTDLQTDYHNDEFFCHVDFDHDMEDAQRAQILAPHPACCGCADCEARYAA